MNSIIYIILAVCLIAVVFFAANYLLKRTYWYRNQFIDAKKFCAGVPDGLQMINLGSSQPKFAFDYSGTGIRGMNMALAPQPFVYDFRILQQYARHLRKGAVVLIPVCPFKFFVYKYANDATNRKYYPFLRKDYIDGYTAGKKRILLHFPVLTAGKRILRILRDEKKDTRMDLTDNPMGRELLKADARKWVDGWKKQFGIDDLNDFSLSEKNRENIDKNIALVKEMLSFCHANGLRPVFAILPVTEELRSHFPESYIAKYVIENIERAKTGGEPILDFFHDEKYRDPGLYINSFFFNAKGRKAFTKSVVKQLSEQ